MKLNLGCTVLLLLVVGLVVGLGLILRHDRSTGGDTARGVRGNGGARRVDDALLLARPLGPLDFLHVGHPEVPSSLASPHDGPNESRDVCENYKVPR